MSTKNAFRLNKVHDLIVAGQWVTYDQDLDPGTLWSWGRNNCGQLGQNDQGQGVTDRSSPVQIPGTNWTRISAGASGSRAIKGDGTLWSWGTSVGDGFDIGLAPRSSPIQIPGTSWNDVSAGQIHTLARKTDGTLWAWGSASRGQLANNNSDSLGVSSPAQIPGTEWCFVKAAYCRTHAIKTDGTLWSWGGNNHGGPLGDDTIIPRSSPVQVPGSTWVEIGGGPSLNHTLGRKTDGTLWSWGYNCSGELGHNSTVHRSSPTQVPGTSWNDVAVSCCTSFARKTDGTLWSWGRQCCGSLGDSTNIHRSSPAQIPGTSWNDIAAGQLGFLARKTDGTLWAWGDNRYGAIGDNTRIDKSSPIQIPGTTWGCITHGANHALARKF